MNDNFYIRLIKYFKTEKNKNLEYYIIKCPLLRIQGKFIIRKQFVERRGIYKNIRLHFDRSIQNDSEIPRRPYLHLPSHQQTEFPQNYKKL